MLARLTVGLVRHAARSVRSRTHVAAPVAWLSSDSVKEWPGVTNSASRFDPRKFLQSEGPHPDAEVASLRRALLYRSRQTGWLETDLIMGRWAAENLDKLSVEELQEYAKIVQVGCHDRISPRASVHEVCLLACLLPCGAAGTACFFLFSPQLRHVWPAVG